MAKKTSQKTATSTTKKAAPATTKTTAKAAVKTTTRKASSAEAPAAEAPTATTTAKKAAASRGVLGLPLKTWVSGLSRARKSELRGGKRGFIIAFGHREQKALNTVLKAHLTTWQMNLFKDSESETQFFQGTHGPVWIIRAPQVSNRQASEQTSHSLEKSGYARFRDLFGGIVSQLSTYKLDKLILEFHDLSLEEERGAIVGLELATYSYAENRSANAKKRKELPNVMLGEASELLTDAEIQSASRLALGVNIARHFTNIPGGELNPRTYSEAVEALFEGSRSVEVEIWEGEKLVQEKMNLMLAVGGAAAEGPRLVHLRYRPENAPVGVKPIAIVGKGITFDSGGLDIKPSSAMRWMKKDMGGSAAAVGLMKWAELSNLALPLDIYLALAENAVGSKSFRPGDIIEARSGLTIEIHNTDAEGRLVLADALDVAVTQEGENEPAAVINLATLTGAIKVGLGAEIAGLFCNNDDLATQIFEAGLARGDLSWRMPLFQPYKTLFRSTFADHANASDGFAGAITAALFLELFVKNKPWAHLDIYAWKDSAGGAFAEAGGNGQPVQALAEVLSRLASGRQADSRA